MQLVKFKSQKAALIKNSHDDIDVWERKKVHCSKKKNLQFQTNWYKMFINLRALNLRKGHDKTSEAHGPLVIQFLE